MAADLGLSTHSGNCSLFDGLSQGKFRPEVLLDAILNGQSDHFSNQNGSSFGQNEVLDAFDRLSRAVLINPVLILILLLH
jgi:hypothetical protein